VSTKKQLILDYFRTHRLERVAREEISALGAELRRAHSPQTVALSGMAHRRR